MMKLFCLVTISLLLTACMSVPYPKKNDYLLQAASIAPLTAQPLADSLTVIPMLAIAPYNNNEFVYQLKNQQYKSDFYNVFFTAPSNMLTQALMVELNQSHLFSAVNLPALQLPARYVLKTELVTLQANYTDHDHPSADIRIEALLLENNHILLDKQYAAQTLLTEKSTAALITAWNTSLSTVYEQLLHDMQQLLLPSTLTTTEVTTANTTPAKETAEISATDPVFLHLTT